MSQQTPVRRNTGPASISSAFSAPPTNRPIRQSESSASQRPRGRSGSRQGSPSSRTSSKGKQPATGRSPVATSSRQNAGIRHSSPGPQQNQKPRRANTWTAPQGIEWEVQAETQHFEKPTAAEKLSRGGRREGESKGVKGRWAHLDFGAARYGPLPKYP
ncbi:hypothetical protein P389DRAFT_5257 [Cystobasidium minutum MCA 4210]|uniref:uncharacterized protein n=1 Tax=Cystobasidium minutum MCA 4210 TaxID=1397322 RepID=UPI0034CED70A|eukprot:jgi/Rhomi1/5257/CE5256_262